MPAEIRQREYVPADSPGSSILLRGVYEQTLAGFDALGERGVPSEEVADRAVEAFTAFHGGRGAVDRHMADQVLVVLAIAGGQVEIPAVTDHVETNLAVLRAFGSDIGVTKNPDGTATVAASPLADAG
jgi:RNA 3'-terminal phosphate cyclase (ATP)